MSAQKWLFRWVPVQGNVNHLLFKPIADALEGFLTGADAPTKWVVSCVVYRTGGKDAIVMPETELARELLVFTTPEAPNRKQLVLPAERLVLEADDGIDAFLELFKGRKVARDFSSAGDQQAAVYKVHDTLRLDGLQLTAGGGVTLRPVRVLRGTANELLSIALELCSATVALADLIVAVDELVADAGLPGRFELLDPPFDEYGLPDCSSALGSAISYASLIDR